MAKIDAIDVPKLTWPEAAAPSTPASGKVVTYAKADGLMYSKDDAGVEVLMSSGAGSGIAATIFDVKGDIIAASAADTAARLAAGTNGKSLLAASGETTGLIWAYPVGALIGQTMYGTAGSYVTTTTFADMDATNLLVAFTVPTTGKVHIRLECQVFNGSTTGTLLWGLRESTTTVAGPFLISSADGLGAGKVDTYVKTFLVTGLTPGDSKTYKWGAKHATNSWTNRWDSAADGNGYAVMQVFVAP